MNSDLDRCLDMYASLAVGGDEERMYLITIPGAPHSKSRPRFGNGRTFTPKGDIDAEKRTGAYIRQIVDKPLTGNVAMGCLFFRPNRQRIDTDNLLKHVGDASNGIVWEDDSQCTAIMGVMELDADNPRTVIVIGKHTSTMARGTDNTFECPVCGKNVPVISSRPAKTCGIECSSLLRGYQSLATLVPCEHCTELFTRKTKTQTFCSQQCRIDSLRDQKRAAASPMSRCQDCDIELAHKRGGRCRECWKSNLKVISA